MAIAILRSLTRQVPVVWERTLRRISPHSRVSPWLALRWFPMVRDGQDCGRWLLSECVPEEVIRECWNTDQQDILKILAGPQPSTLPDDVRVGVLMVCNDYQWEMYRKHRVYARELWIIQGENGGHATSYEQEERNLLQVVGLPTDPPALGDLPYAPFDQRVIRQMQRRNRLVQFGNDLNALRKSGSTQALDAEAKQHGVEFRRQYLAFLTEQSRATADLVTWYSSKSDHRDELPSATPQQLSAVDVVAEQYVQTGLVPA